MNKVFRGVLMGIGIIAGFIPLAIFGMFLFFRVLFGANYDKQDLIENYQEKHQEITVLKAYFIPRVPANTEVHIEFDGDNELGIFHVGQQGLYSQNWSLKTDSPKVDSLLTILGWNQQTLKDLKANLDEANCISIESGEPITIGYQRSGMGMYFYKLFDQPLTDSLKSQYNDGCTYSYYKEQVVLEYGGGAVGPQCFEDYKRE